MLPKEYADQDCSIARALEAVGERWTFLVLRDAFYGVRRYSDFRDRLGIPRAVLAARLADLVDRGLMRKDGHAYLLTELGQGLWPALLALSRWGEELAPGRGGKRKVFRHAGCGGELDRHCRCGRCAAVVEAADAEVRPGPGADDTREDPVSAALRKPHRLLDPLP